MFKKVGCNLLGFLAVLFLATNAQAGFKLKGVLKGKDSGSSSTGSTSSSSSGVTQKSKFTYKLVNKDDIDYKIKHVCNGEGDDWNEVEETLKAGKSFEIKGKSCTVKFYTPWTSRYKTAMLGTQQDVEKWIVYGDNIDPSTYDYHTTGDIGDSQRVHFEAKKFTYWINEKYKSNDRGTSYNSAVSGVTKHLGKGPKAKDDYKATWIVKRKDFGQYCMEARVSSGFDYKTKNRYFQGGSATLRSGSNCN